MADMKEILYQYKNRKYSKCLELVTLLNESDNDVENFILENCRLVCESYISINANDPAKIFEMQEHHYLFFEKVTSLGIYPNSIPIQLRLNATFNFIYWLLFYTDVEFGAPEKEKYLELINKGLESVSGREAMPVTTLNLSEKVLSSLMCLKNLILHQEFETVLLILEVVIVTIVYVIKLKKNMIRDCLEVVSSFVKESKHVSGDKFLQAKPTSLCLFKFSLSGSGTLLSDLNLSIIDHLYLLESTLLFLLEDFKGSLNSLQKNMHTSDSSLWNYLVALNSYELGNWNVCSKFLMEMSGSAVQNSLKARCHILQGKLNCVERRHKDALRQFENALSVSPNCPIIYYYMGQEYGKMGLIDSMVENFQKLLQVIQFGEEEEEENLKPNFESTLLEWIHPISEITEAEASYALAVSYGLNENFVKAAETFEKVLESLDGEVLDRKRRIVELPNYLTILHEASVMNLLLGNLVRAEQISLDAIDRYVAQKFSKARDRQVTLLDKDIEWLERVIQQELLGTGLEPNEPSKETLYAEDSLFFFPRDVIALLILSEIQRIQEIVDYMTTLSDVFCIFSKYLALMQKKEQFDDDEKHTLTLVKALAGKTCVRIANIQIKLGNDSNVEKMFKRALSCNKGDKDALYNYYKFLIRSGKNKEALKLWNTFSKEKVTIELDSLQSFCLRYFLTDKITDRELEKTRREIETTDIKFS